jgi:hypothetical protein
MDSGRLFLNETSSNSMECLEPINWKHKAKDLKINDDCII